MTSSIARPCQCVGKRTHKQRDRSAHGDSQDRCGFTRTLQFGLLPHLFSSAKNVGVSIRSGAELLMKARLSRASGRAGLAVPMIVTGAIVALLTLSALIYREDLALRDGSAAALVILAAALFAVSLGSRARPAQAAPRDVA